jgi:P4 family phage/plasmid primase-like protien
VKDILTQDAAPVAQPQNPAPSGLFSGSGSYQAGPLGKDAKSRAKGNAQDVRNTTGEAAQMPHGELSNTHKEKLKGISAEVIEARGYATEKESGPLEELGFSKACNPALVIPWRNVFGEIGGYQIRPDAPLPDLKGKPRKYLFPAGRKNFADVPPICLADLTNPKKPLWIVEGPIKADFLASLGACVIGLAGVPGWIHTNEDGTKTAIPCFREIGLNGRAVYICFDSDLKHKPAVYKQAVELKNYLESKGARVFIIGIPDAPNGEKQGPDDFLQNSGTFEELQSYVITKPSAPRETPKAPTAPDPQKVADEQAQATPDEDTFKITLGYPLTDTGNAERFISQHGARVLYSKALGWHLYKNGVWEKDETDLVFEMGKRTVRGIYQEASAAPDDKRIKIGEWAKTSESLTRRSAMIETAGKDGPKAKVDDFDRDGWLFNVQNGTFDLRTGEFREHRRADLITKMAPVTYDAKASCPHFIEFLAAILDAPNDYEAALELVIFLQRFFGYTLTGSTREQCFIILHGDGSNGKSTLLNVLRALLGDYCKQTKPDTLMQKKFGEGISNDVAMLRGARMVTAIETNEGRQLDEAKIKEMTGGDPVTARFLRKEFFTFTPEYKIFLATNHKPQIQGMDNGIWRRVRLVPFDVQFWNAAKGETGPAHLEADKELEDKLKGELPGILNWAVQGCMDWQRYGLPAPKRVIDATAEYRVEQDPLETFLSERCYRTEACKVTNGDLTDAYAKWAKTEDQPALSHRAFFGRMKQKGFEQKRGTGGVKWWLGLGLLLTGYSEPSEANQ